MPYYRKPVVLDRGDYTTATLNLYGGMITSWRIKNKEMLFIPRKADFDGLRPVYGGIKIAFPYFGSSKQGPKHGFSRFTPYQLESPPKKKNNGDIEVVMTIDNNKFTEAMMHIKFKIIVKITLTVDTLSYEVEVKNMCPHFPLYFAFMRLCMIKVKDIRKCQFWGLRETCFTSLEGDIPEIDWEDCLQCIDVDSRIYLNIPEEVTLLNVTDTKKMVFTHTGDVEMLTWNPYQERVDMHPNPRKDQTDHHDQCYGVGAGEMTQKIRLEPLEDWLFSGDIVVVDEDEERKKRWLQNLDYVEYVSSFC